jgi:hypothetical protein
MRAEPLILRVFSTTGGRGGIRTHETLAGLPVFKTGALNHSATLPCSDLTAVFPGAQGGRGGACHPIAIAPIHEPFFCAAFSAASTLAAASACMFGMACE